MNEHEPNCPPTHRELANHFLQHALENASGAINHAEYDQCLTCAAMYIYPYNFLFEFITRHGTPELVKQLEAILPEPKADEAGDEMPEIGKLIGRLLKNAVVVAVPIGRSSALDRAIASAQPAKADAKPERLN